MSDIRERVARAIIAQMKADDNGIYITTHGDGLNTVDGYVNFDRIAEAALSECGFAEMVALLSELIDIEGPQPGTSEWAGKVRAVLAKARGETT